MKYLIILALALVLFPSYAFADTSSSNQLDARLVPNQIIANTDDIIQVTPKNFGGPVDNLIATSSDSSIVQIQGIENDSAHNAFNIHIRALSPGPVTINMAASGFSSVTMPITVYSDSEEPTSLLIKATPKAFSNPGPSQGYLAVEAVNSNGVPTPVTEDMPIKLSVSDSSVVSLLSNQIVIPKGSYFATGKFAVNTPGNVQLFASGPSMSPVSTPVTITNVATPYTLQAYAYPTIVNDNKDAISYVIVQLHDSGGNPVAAKEDIPVSVRVVNVDQPTSNVSYQNPEAQVNDDLMIKKGTYWGYVPVEFTAGVNATYNVEISAKGYVISTIPETTTITTSMTTPTGSTTVTGTTTPGGTVTSTTTVSGSPITPGSSSSSSTTITAAAPSNTICSNGPAVSSTQVQIITYAQNYLLDDKTPCLYPLPILATGNKELVGILALKDNSGNPVLAKSGLSFRIDSSDTNTVSVPDVPMKYGDQSALVFANVGGAANPVTLNVVSDSPQQVNPLVVSQSQTTSNLVADPLVSTVLPNVQFPLAVYATNNGALDLMKKDFTALISPLQAISPTQLTISKDNTIYLTDATLLKGGPQTISITTPDYSSSFSVTAQESKPSSIELGYPDQIFANTNALFSVEMLDNNNLPIIANKDTDIKIVSSNSSIINLPDAVQIPRGSYYATFDAEPLSAGTAEIAVLADDVPLSKFDVTVTSFTPTVTLDSQDHVDNGVPLTATATVSYNQVNLAGIGVTWKVSGATITHIDKVTDANGKATVTMEVNNPNTVNIEADVGGGLYQTVAASKQITVNPPLGSANVTSTNGQQSGISIFGMSPLLFIIPGAGAAAFFVLKKREMLDGITEKIGIAGKFSEMRERMSGFGEK